MGEREFFRGPQVTYTGKVVGVMERDGKWKTISLAISSQPETGGAVVFRFGGKNLIKALEVCVGDEVAASGYLRAKAGGAGYPGRWFQDLNGADLKVVAKGTAPPPKSQPRDIDDDVPF